MDKKYQDGQLYFIMDENSDMALVRYDGLDNIFRLDVYPSVSLPADEAKLVIPLDVQTVVEAFRSMAQSAQVE